MIAIRYFFINEQNTTTNTLHGIKLAKNTKK